MPHLRSAQERLTTIITTDGKLLDVREMLEWARGVVATSDNPVERGLATTLEAALLALNPPRTCQVVGNPPQPWDQGY